MDNVLDILKPNYIYENVNGAPFEIGQSVKILHIDDIDVYRFNNRMGTIVFFEYECGCGQTYPDDPMIGVKLDDDFIYEFWQEELSAVD